MWKYLEKLRQKSNEEKKSIALLFSFGITLLIFVIWISIYRINRDEVTANTVSPFQEIVSSFEQVFGNGPTLPKNSVQIIEVGESAETPTTSPHIQPPADEGTLNFKQ
jgi:hypothetical protein